MKLDDSVSAVVTGGASGLGEATARALASANVRVAIFDMNEEKGHAVAREIGAYFCKVDVTADASVAAGFAGARAAQGQDRILVNCAGIVAGARTVSRHRETGTISAFPMDLFRRVIEVNLVGSFRCLAASAAGMAILPLLEHGAERGVIVNTASVAATDGQIGQAAYAASKAGILGLNLPVARDLGAEGIRVNAILPGTIETPMMAGVSEQVRTSLAASIVFPKRPGRPDEFASLALELIRNGYINGAAIRLDGALRMPPR